MDTDWVCLISKVIRRGHNRIHLEARFIRLGGSDNLPDNLPSPYYDGFVGCIKSVHVEETELHLVRHSSFDLQLNFCEDGT